MTVFDILVAICFFLIIYSVYKMLKPEGIRMFDMVHDEGRENLVKKERSAVRMPKEFVKFLKSESVEGKIEKLTKVDKNFDMDNFIEDSKNLFTNILVAFEKKDRNILKKLTSSIVFNELDTAIYELTEKKHKIETEVVRFKKVFIKDITVNKSKVDIKVEFVTEQVSTLKNNTGRIVKGDENQIETIVDNWILNRDYKKTSNWLLSKTIEV